MQEITIGVVIEIAQLHELDAELFPLFSIAVFRCARLTPGTCVPIVNQDESKSSFIAVKNSNDTMIILATRGSTFNNAAVFTNPFFGVYKNEPEYLTGLNISKYLIPDSNVTESN